MLNVRLLQRRWTRGEAPLLALSENGSVRSFVNPQVSSGNEGSFRQSVSTVASKTVDDVLFSGIDVRVERVSDFSSGQALAATREPAIEVGSQTAPKMTPGTFLA